MENRGGRLSVLGILAVVIGIVALSHTLFYAAPYLLNGKQVAGFAFLDSNRLDNIQGISKFRPFSLTIIVFEWILLFTVVLKGRAGRKTVSIGEISRAVSEHKTKGSVAKTDLDVLYDILKQKKEIGISEIAHAFKINKSVAMDWSKMLEDGNLATIEYSRMGEPSVRIK